MMLNYSAHPTTRLLAGASNICDLRAWFVGSLCLLSAAGVQSAALEDEADLAFAYGDKAVVSIATGVSQPLRRAPSVATVITADDIQGMGAVDLDDVLETVPGVHVSRSTQLYSPVYAIRGIHADFNPQVLMLINGVPLTVLLAGNRGFAWGGMPVENISRIEVIRGPGSALYGADAFSGVINVVTKSSSELAGTQVGGRLGSFQTGDAWVLHGGKWGAVNVAAYVRRGTTEGSKRQVEADAQTGFDALFGTRASKAPGPLSLGREALDGSLDFSLEHWRWRLGYAERTDVGSGPGAAMALDPTGRNDSRRMSSDLSYQNNALAANWEIQAQLNYLNYRERSDLVIFPAGAFGGSFPQGMRGAPEKWEQHTRLSLAATYTGLAKHRIRLGAGYAYEDMYRTRETKNFFQGPGLPTDLGAVQDVSSTAPFLWPQTRKVRHAYAQDEWNFAPDWTLTAGLRRDQYSDFGSTTNPRLALVWDVDYNLTAKLLYGSAFRAPAFAELYNINNPVAVGNPKLEPETITTTEAALVWQATPTLLMTGSVFEYRMKDIIRNAGTSFVNSGRQVGRGVELDASWNVSRVLRLSGSYAYQRSIDQMTQHDAGNAPGNQLYLRADWRLTSRWLVNGQVNSVADRKRVLGDVRPPVKDYTTVDLSVLSPRVKTGWEVTFTVKNLFNVDAREPSPAGVPFVSLPGDLPLPRRSVYLMASYAL
jgi:outer membrane receptor for ferrienterochelin and colicins